MGTLARLRWCNLDLVKVCDGIIVPEIDIPQNGELLIQYFVMLSSSSDWHDEKAKFDVAVLCKICVRGSDVMITPNLQLGGLLSASTDFYDTLGPFSAGLSFTRSQPDNDGFDLHGPHHCWSTTLSCSTGPYPATIDHTLPHCFTELGLGGQLLWSTLSDLSKHLRTHIHVSMPPLVV